MIANCPACGTHYKHEQPVLPARGRCGRCDATIDLSRLRPYRIVPVAAPLPVDAARAARHLPIGLDDPVLATTIARNVVRSESREASLPGISGAASAPVTSVVAALAPPGPPPDAWEGDDPLPPIPEMTTRGAYDPSVPRLSETDILHDLTGERGADGTPVFETSPVEGRGTTFALWLAAGAIVGTGVSWTLGGATLAGVTAGGFVGALTGWGWTRWTSPK